MTADEIPTTLTGVNRRVVVPSPNWPSKFIPQHFTVPSDNRAHELSQPAATCVADKIPGTTTGTELPAVVPSPS